MAQIQGLQVKSFEGKTISKIKFNLTWRGSPDEFKDMVIEFTDGTKLEIDAISEAGCENCDADGRACTYLDLWKVEAE